MIHDNPVCPPIQELEPGLDYFSAVCRELRTPHGYVDNLLMTGRGDIALVETKLFRNPEARRAVLAQPTRSGRRWNVNPEPAAHDLLSNE